MPQLHRFYCKWVDSSETTFNPVTHAVNEIGAFAFSLSQQEGEFAILTIVARNPNEGLLNPARQQWLWFSWQETNSTVTPLFFGRIVGVPEDITQQKIAMVFRARPLGFRALKEALAETLKVAPYYDPIWVPPERRDDVDNVLVARTAKWHIDRITHAVSITDNHFGEDGSLAFGEDNIINGSFSCRYSGAAASRVKVHAEIRWTQTATGVVDITPAILRAAAVAGSGNGFNILSYTGGSVINDWPLPNDNIGGGWTVEDSAITEGTGRWVSRPQALQMAKTIWYKQPDEAAPQTVTLVRGRFDLWHAKPFLSLRYNASRGRTELIDFEMTSEVQALLTDPGEDDDDIIEINVASNDVSEPIDAGGAIPIGDVRRSSYIATDRGADTFQWLIARARATLMDRARVVTMTFSLPFPNIKNVTLRKNASITYDMIPAGVASGKIKSYQATGEGDGGAFSLEISVGSTVGQGGTAAEIAGVADYVDEDYCDPTYQTFTNAYTLLQSSDVSYLEFYSTLDIDDDGINFFDMRATDLLNYVLVTNPATQQFALPSVYENKQAAIDAMEAAKTTICWSIKRLTRGPFETQVDLVVNPLVVPKQIDLESAGI